jgi:prepilin-type N-terminal cleavage/methylation domain-containing protein
MDTGEQSGFTLIEFIVAATLLATIVVAVATTLDSIKAINFSANNLTIGTEAAQQQLELYRNTPYNQIALGTQDISSSLSAYPSLKSPRSATATVTQVDPDGIKQVDIAITYTGQGGTKRIQVSTRVANKGLNP